jgi:hypothetical protein
MSQGAITAGRLAASVRPGRAADGYGSLIAARLRRLAGTLARELRHSVFGMTLDVYRLMVLRLLSAVDYPARPGMRPLRELPERGVLPVSFIRAISTQNGGVR